MIYICIHIHCWQFVMLNRFSMFNLSIKFHYKQSHSQSSTQHLINSKQARAAQTWVQTMVHWSFTKVQVCSRHMPQQVSANRPQQLEAAFPSSPSGGFASLIAGGKLLAVAFTSPDPWLSPPRNNFWLLSSNFWKLSFLYACFIRTYVFRHIVQRENETILIF